ncbi:MAG: hypothetical protein QM704_18520 [Anaeromyxobacteraceae bacterium]
MPPPSMAPGAARPRRRPSGGALVNVLFLLGVAGLCYLGWMWVPVYVDHYEVIAVTRDHMNQAVKNHNDEALIQSLAKRASGVGVETGRDENGRRWEEPTIQVEPGDIAWERDEAVTPPMLHVEFDYEREVPYPLLDRTTTHTFHVGLQQDLEVPVWNTK